MYQSGRAGDEAKKRESWHHCRKFGVLHLSEGEKAKNLVLSTKFIR